MTSLRRSSAAEAAIVAWELQSENQEQAGSVTVMARGTPQGTERQKAGLVAAGSCS